MTRIAVVAGSVRPGRYSRSVADWVLAQAAQRSDAEFHLVDLADHPLSFYTDFENFVSLVPGAHQVKALSDTLDQVVAWSDALATLRK